MQRQIYTSIASDGSMKSLDGDQSTARKNRTVFLAKNDINPADTTLHTLSYGGDNYCRYRELHDDDKGDGILRDSTIDADAVVVTHPNHAILLPLGDCVGAIIHDPTRDILMVSHLGRQNLEQYGGTKCIQYLIDNYGIDPTQLTVWLSPSAGDGYPLHAFDNHSLQEVTLEQLAKAGVDEKKVNISTINTLTNLEYYSHSEFLKGNRRANGRFCIVAVMRD